MSSVEELIERFFPGGIDIYYNQTMSEKTYLIQEKDLECTKERLDMDLESHLIISYEIGRMIYTNGSSIKVTVKKAVPSKKFSIKPIGTKRVFGYGDTIEEAINDFLTNREEDNPVKGKPECVLSREYKVLYTSN